MSLKTAVGPRKTRNKPLCRITPPFTFWTRLHSVLSLRIISCFSGLSRTSFYKANTSRLNPMAVVLLAGLSGCTPTRIAVQPKLSAPQNWHHDGEAAGITDAAKLKTWWQGFQDPRLNALISQALAANHDLKIAQARVRAAEAMVTIAESVLYPNIDAFSSGGREKRIDRVIGVPGSQGLTLLTPTSDAISGGLAARWEIDLFGARRLEAEAAAAQSEGSKAALHAAQVGLLAQVATHYLELRGVQRRIGILRANIDVQRERLRALQTFYRAGLAHDSDLARQESLLLGTEALLPGLTAAEAALIHRLGVLLGEPPGKLANRLVSAERWPSGTPAVPKLLPSVLLAQRPDLRQAQSEVDSAAAALGAARAEMYPKLVLSASGGFGALAVGGFSGLSDSVYALGSGLTAPIFNAGRIKAQITSADARLDQVAAHYEKTFLLALEDVENAYVAHASSSLQRERWSEAETAADKAYRLSVELYQRGAGDYLSVLDAQRSKLAVADELAKAETASRVALVSLYRAFGGGWADGYNNLRPFIGADR